MIVGIGERQTNAVKAGLVGRIGVATAGIVSGVRFFDLFEDHRIIFHLVGAEIVGHVHFGRRTGLNADGSAGKLQCGIDARQLLRIDHEALTIEVIDAGKIEAERSVAADGPGRVTDQDVDFA